MAAATGSISAGQCFTFYVYLKYNAKIVLSGSYAQSNKWKAYDEDMRESYNYLIDENRSVGLTENYMLSARTDITEWSTIIYDEFTLSKGAHLFTVSVKSNTGKGNPNIDYLEFNCTEATSGEVDDTKIIPDNDFHNNLQYAYLQDEDVTNIFSYATGVEDLSKPRALYLDFSSDMSVLNGDSYVIEIAANDEFVNSIIKEGLTVKKLGIINLKLGQQIYYRGANSQEKLVDAKVYSMKITEEGPRNLWVDGVDNVRDVGGYSSSLVPGGTIRQGLYYRGAKLNDITETGKNTIYNTLGVRVEIDLRDIYQCTGTVVEGLKYEAISIPSGTESTRFELFNEEYIAIFDLLANAEEEPIFLHCTAGADRTGIMTFALLTLCGVEYEDVATDYCFTNFGMQGSRNINTEFENWWSKLDDYEGGTKADRCEAWLMSKGISYDILEKVREIFVIGYVAKTS